MGIKRSLVLILMCLISISAFADVPTREQIESVWENSPEVIVEMVQKLYILEHADPELVIPDLQIFELEDGSTIVKYDGIMNLTIGTPKFNLLYDIELEPQEVIIGYKVEPIPILWPWFVLDGVLSFALGVGAGYLVPR